MADYTTTRLLSRIKKRAGLPVWTDADLDSELLERANDEQGTYLAAILEGAKAELKQTYLDITVTSATRYPIPTRAIAAGVKMLEGVTSAGVQWLLVELADRDFTGLRTGDFYIEGNEIVFFRAPPTGTLRVTYSRRLSELVVQTSARAITAINTGTKTVTIAASPTGFNGLTAMDLVQGKPHFDLLSMDAACSAIGVSATSVVFSSALPSGLAIGDWVCVPGESPVVQAPLELHKLLAQQAAFTYLDDKGDDKSSAAEKRRNRLEKDINKLIAERVQEGKLLINRNGPGFQSPRRGVRTSGVAP